jgi:mono/diheme cytochrome c family protein
MHMMRRHSESFVCSAVCAGCLFLLVIPTHAAPKSVAAFRDAPPVTASWSNPYVGQRDAERAGGKLFRHHCADCHGPDAQGQDRAPSLHSAKVQSASAGALFWFLTNGDLGHGMPEWSRLPDERRWQLVSYIQSLGPGGQDLKGSAP